MIQAPVNQAFVLCKWQEQNLLNTWGLTVFWHANTWLFTVSKQVNKNMDSYTYRGQQPQVKNLKFLEYWNDHNHSSWKNLN